MPWKSFSFRWTATCLLSSWCLFPFWASVWAAEREETAGHGGREGGQGTRGVPGSRRSSDREEHLTYQKAAAAAATQVTRRMKAQGVGSRNPQTESGEGAEMEGAGPRLSRTDSPALLEPRRGSRRAERVTEHL